MDPLTTVHMLLGAVFGWGILSPLAKTEGWAPGPVESWENSSQGWTIWIALGIILGDSLIGIFWIIFQFFTSGGKDHTGILRSSQFKRNRTPRPSLSPRTRDSDEALASHNISDSFEHSPLLPETGSRVEPSAPNTSGDTNLSWKTLAFWLIGGSLFCFLTTWYLFNGLLTSWQLILSIVVIFPLGMASIRSMGETDNSLASTLGGYHYAIPFS